MSAIPYRETQVLHSESAAKRLLAQFEVISSDFVFTIVDPKYYYPILEQLAAEHIVELVGIDGEILRLNDIVRDYIKRNKIKLNNQFEKLIDKNVRSIIKDDEIFERDSSEYIFVLKEALKEGMPVKEELLIPSHYLRCMKDLYYSRGNLDRIIQLADIVLQKQRTLERRLLQDIRYYLCLALAKKKDKRLLAEVKHIRGDEHSFLLGYYYRLCGRLREALERFEGIVGAKYVGDRAKREIVQVYVQLEEYDKALGFAKNNYDGHRGNQFHTQAYFNCLVNSRDAKSNKRTLKELIANLREIDSEQSNEMADIADAIYCAKIDNNRTSAFDKIRDCVDAMPNNHYPLLAMCDLAIKYEDLDILQEGVEKLRVMKSKKHVSSRTFNKYEAYVHALNGDSRKAISSLKEDLSRYPEVNRDRIIHNLQECADKRSL